MAMKKKIGTIIAFVFLALIMVSALIVFRGRKPFKDLEMTSATVQLLPPDETIQVANLEELGALLEDVVIYNRDDSYREYSGQAVVFTITRDDGSKLEVTAYNPFIIIDEKGYRCKYEPCEKLNSYANELLNAVGNQPEIVTTSGASDAGFPNWGLTLSVKDVTESGLTLVCTQSDGALTGELQTGSDYKLIVLKEAWEDVPTIIEDYGWTAEAYMIAKDDVTELEIKWEWLHGKLPAGTYRLVKGFTDFRESGDYDNFAYWTEFVIK